LQQELGDVKDKAHALALHPELNTFVHRSSYVRGDRIQACAETERRQRFVLHTYRPCHGVGNQRAMTRVVGTEIQSEKRIEGLTHDAFCVDCAGASPKLLRLALALDLLGF
jgi:hypothetical protein